MGVEWLVSFTGLSVSIPATGIIQICRSSGFPAEKASQFPLRLKANAATPPLASVSFRASPPSGLIMYSWFSDAADAPSRLGEPAALEDGASRFDSKAKNLPSRDQCCDVSSLSLVDVICL